MKWKSYWKETYSKVSEYSYVNMYLIHKSGEQETDGKKIIKEILEIPFFEDRLEFSDQKDHWVLDLW